jgi:uncharacterized protein YjbI with pentapeptide repeats/uncharacterized membrane protein YqjE
MGDRTEQKHIIKRLGEQITNSFGWIKGQVQSNSLLSILVVILLLLFTWIIWETARLDNLGFDKTLWGWMELLIIPTVLAIGAWWLNKSERENEREIAEKNREEDRRIADERRHQATLEAYFDRMVELLLEHDLMDDESEREVLSTIARTRTLAVLRSLDANRKGHVVQFLYESGLISTERVVVSLDKADLSGANLGQANLSGANLSKAYLGAVNLSGANLSVANLSEARLSKAYLGAADLGGANLSGARLSEANLMMANLSGANLTYAILEVADLTGASLRGANLSMTYLRRASLRLADLSGAKLEEATVAYKRLVQAKSLKGTTLPDGTKLSEENWQAEFEKWRDEQD